MQSFSSTLTKLNDMEDVEIIYGSDMVHLLVSAPKTRASHEISLEEIKNDTKISKCYSFYQNLKEVVYKKVPDYIKLYGVYKENGSI